MQRKKTTKKKRKTTKRAKAGANGFAGPRTIDGVLHFAQLDLLLYDRAQQRVVNAKQTMALKNYEISEASHKYREQMAALQTQMAEVSREHKNQVEELQQLQIKLAEVYEIDFADLSYDDETGRIHVAETPVLRE